MERIELDGIPYIKGYHTQSKSDGVLKEPKFCNSDDAWLGEAYYFWIDKDFALNWGNDFKNKDKSGFNIYSALLNSSKVLNTTFDEKSNEFYVSSIEHIVSYLKSKKKPISYKNVNKYLRLIFLDKKGIRGIIYDDLPTNPKSKKRVYSEITHKYDNGNEYVFYYKKRIQCAMFYLDDIIQFTT